MRASISVPFGIAVSSVRGTNFFVPGSRTRTMPRSGLATPCLPSTGCGTGAGAATTVSARAVALAPRGSVTRTPTVRSRARGSCAGRTGCRRRRTRRSRRRRGRTRTAAPRPPDRSSRRRRMSPARRPPSACAVSAAAGRGVGEWRETNGRSARRAGRRCTPFRRDRARRRTPRARPSRRRSASPAASRRAPLRDTVAVERAEQEVAVGRWPGPAAPATSARGAVEREPLGSAGSATAPNVTPPPPNPASARRGQAQRQRIPPATPAAVIRLAPSTWTAQLADGLPPRWRSASAAAASSRIAVPLR